MAQFDVYRTRTDGLVLDCQSEAFADIATRLVVPLLPLDAAPPRQPRLNPVFDIDGTTVTLVTQFATALRVAELRTRVASLEDRRLAIIGAFDMLPSSF